LHAVNQTREQFWFILRQESSESKRTQLGRSTSGAASYAAEFAMCVHKSFPAHRGQRAC
jgi:hypothetical protein